MASFIIIIDDLSIPRIQRAYLANRIQHFSPEAELRWTSKLLPQGGAATSEPENLHEALRARYASRKAALSQPFSAGDTACFLGGAVLLRGSLQDLQKQLTDNTPFIADQDNLLHASCIVWSGGGEKHALAALQSHAHDFSGGNATRLQHYAQFFRHTVTETYVPLLRYEDRPWYSMRARHNATWCTVINEMLRKDPSLQQLLKEDISSRVVRPSLSELAVFSTSMQDIAEAQDPRYTPETAALMDACFVPPECRNSDAVIKNLLGAEFKERIIAWHTKSRLNKFRSKPLQARLRHYVAVIEKRYVRTSQKKFRSLLKLLRQRYRGIKSFGAGKKVLLTRKARSVGRI